jgi:hypothetical protein
LARKAKSAAASFEANSQQFDHQIVEAEEIDDQFVKTRTDQTHFPATVKEIASEQRRIGVKVML